MAELKGHSNPVSSVAFSNDGRLLVSGGGDLIVKVWDVQNGTEVRSLRGHGDWVSSVAFGSDSRFILSASVDKTVKLWELSNEETVPPIGHTRRLETVAVSADGKLLASGSDDRTIKIWDMPKPDWSYIRLPSIPTMSRSAGLRLNRRAALLRGRGPQTADLGPQDKEGRTYHRLRPRAGHCLHD